MNDWSMLRKLIWLHVISGGSSGARTTVTGVSPLALVNALAKPIRSLIQYGKVTTSNGEMYCNNGKLVAVDDELSVVGTPEVLTVGEQTASVENLLAVDDIKDEQNIISGMVTRRCEAAISDGTTPSGRYIGTVGEGNIIVKVRETGYEGDIATFEATEAKPLNGLSVNVEPIQDLHGYDSPWPAGGGKNKFSDVWSEYTRPNDYYIHPVSLTQGETYYISATLIGEAVSGIVVALIKDGDRYTNFVGSTTIINTSGEIFSRAFAIDATYTNPKIAIYCSGEAKFNQIFANYHIQLEIGRTPSAWTPYSNICPISGRTSATIYHSGADTSDPTTYTIQLGQTVYGGTLDVTQGKMVVTHKYATYNGTENWNIASSNAYMMVWNQTPSIGNTDLTQIANWLVGDGNRYAQFGKYRAQSNGAVCVGNVIDSNNSVYKWTSSSEFKAYLANNPLSICYAMATPIEITLTPTQIDTLIGQNNIWSDAGSVKAYVADGDLVEHVTAQPMRTAEGSNAISVTSAVAPVQLSATYTRAET